MQWPQERHNHQDFPSKTLQSIDHTQSVTMSHECWTISFPNTVIHQTYKKWLRFQNYLLFDCFSVEQTTQHYNLCQLIIIIGWPTYRRINYYCTLMALAGITTMHYSNIQHIWYGNLRFQSSVSLKQTSIQFELLEKMQSKEVVIVYNT